MHEFYSLEIKIDGWLQRLAIGRWAVSLHRIASAHNLIVKIRQGVDNKQTVRMHKSRSVGR